MAAPVYQAISYVDAGVTATPTGTEPTGTTSGDILVACIHASSTGGTAPTFTAPSGGEWTLIGQTSTTGGTGAKTATYWCRRGGSAPNYQWGTTGGYIFIGIFRANGAISSGDPTSGHNETFDNNNTTISTSFSTADNETLLLAFGTSWDGSSGNITGWTERLENIGGAELDAYSTAGPATAGSTGTITYTNSGSSATMTIAVVAIKPAAAASASRVLQRPRNRIITRRTLY